MLPILTCEDTSDFMHDLTVCSSACVSAPEMEQVCGNPQSYLCWVLSSDVQV